MSKSNNDNYWKTMHHDRKLGRQHKHFNNFEFRDQRVRLNACCKSELGFMIFRWFHLIAKAWHLCESCKKAIKLIQKLRHKRWQIGKAQLEDNIECKNDMDHAKSNGSKRLMKKYLQVGILHFKCFSFRRWDK